MPIDRFSKARFEAALPTHKVTGDKLWNERGFIMGQFVYEVQVAANVFIQIFSSIDSSGYARDVAEDSIRFAMVDANGNLLSNKLQKYVTRVNGWEARVVAMLRKMWEMGRIAGKACDRCNNDTRGIFATKKDEPYEKDGKWYTNKGRLFTKCPRCYKFDWLTEAKEIEAPKVATA